MRLRRIAVALALPVAAALPAFATIIGGSVTGGTAKTAGGTFIKLAPPPAVVGNDNFNTPNLYGFDEDQNILLAAALPTDLGTNPIPAGSTVASHYVFFDPGPTQTIIGTVDFDSDVYAIITGTGKLMDSDFLANTGVTYLSPSARGLEAGDSVAISGVRQIKFDVSASSPGDYVRVLTRFSPGAVPEPGSAFLLTGGLAAFAFGRRRRYR